MRLVQSRPHPTASRQFMDPEVLSAQRLDRWRTKIERAILEAAGGSEDELLKQSVRAAVDAFFDTRADVRRASAAVEHLLERIGEQQARRGFGPADLAASFRAAHITAQKGLATTLGDQITRDALLEVREDLVAYCSELHLRTHVSLVRSRRLHAMTSEQRRGRLGAMAFGRDLSTEMEKLAELEGLDPATPVVAIVSVSSPLPVTIRGHRQAIAGGSELEVLVPESWDLDLLAVELTGQATAGPPVPLVRATEGVALARRAADLLRDGTLDDARRLVPCTDLLGNLIVGSSQLLAQLVIDKHLHVLDDMPLVRQLALGELALAALDSGRSIDGIAAQLGIPRQTAHSRMKTVRTIFGETLKDPSQRLELIIALRAALPRWRATLAHATP